MYHIENIPADYWLILCLLITDPLPASAFAANVICYILLYPVTVQMTVSTIVTLFIFICEVGCVCVLRGDDLHSTMFIFISPLYNFFHKKVSYRDFLMYNKFATKTQKGVTLYDKLIIQQNSLIGRLNSYFSLYFETFSVPTAQTLFLLLLSILALESAHSIRFLYRHFLSGITGKSLNAFYYACSHAKADYSRFMNVTASMALRLVPDSLRTQPVFEDVSVLFDHAAHRGSSYLNGHCFVSLMLCVPVWKKDKISWLSVPLGYRMWTKQKSKLELAADMIRQVMPECQKQKNVILLCDSWYMKKPLVSIPEEYPNLDMIGNVRADSVLYDLPPERTGRKGRPAGHGNQLSIETDFIFSDKKIDGYFIAVRPVITNLFGSRKVLAYVTAPEPGSGKKKLFFSTVFPEQLQIFCAWQEKAPLKRTGSAWMKYIPLFFYGFRWNIEISYYELKTFWSLCSYMVRSRSGIERPQLTNLHSTMFIFIYLMTG